MSVRKRESKKAKNGYVWEVIIKYKDCYGVQQRYSKSGFKTKSEAQVHEADIKKQLAETNKIKKVVNKTVDQVFNEFIEIEAPMKYQENTIYTSKRVYKKHIKNKIGTSFIRSFNYSNLQNFFNELSEQGASTNKDIYKVLVRIFKYARKCEYIDNYYLDLINVTGKNTTQQKNKTFTTDEFDMVINELLSANKFSYKSYAIALYIARYTGARISEAFALNKEDIDLSNDIISINKKLLYRGRKKANLEVTEQLKSKSSKSLLPIAKPLKEILIDWFECNPYERVVCDEDGSYLNPSVLSSILAKISKKLGIQFNFHMTRHTLATDLVMNNIDIKTAQELMRHAKFSTTADIYTHVKEEKKLDAINSIFSDTKN